MADPRYSSFSYNFPGPTPQATARWAANLEMANRAMSVKGPDGLHAQARRRRTNDKRIIENPLAHYTDEELVADVHEFQRTCLSHVPVEQLVRAARVAKDIRAYDQVARSPEPNAGWDLPVKLDDRERRALRRERDVVFSERGMYVVIMTVSLAAFLQGFVQSSINGAALYLDPDKNGGSLYLNSVNETDRVSTWAFGAANAAPYLFAAAVGCPLALPINQMVGRRGAMVVAAVLILASSLGAAWCRQWTQLFGVRVLNGIGMGIKAVSTPILASETAVGYWRGTSILAWQLWVAFGIMMGFAFNLIFAQARTVDTTLGLILGAPFVPAVMLLVGLYFCPESPRYYMRRNGPNYNPTKAYDILVRLRNTELQALRDLYLVYKSIEIEEYPSDSSLDSRAPSLNPHGFLYRVWEYFTLYKELFQRRRLRNALISSSTVSLAQQLCGINILAFYSGSFFLDSGSHTGSQGVTSGGLALKAMEYSFGYGAVNFLFGLPAIRTIDTLGRRKWLTVTIPIMCVFMSAAAASCKISTLETKIGVVAAFLYLFAAAYSPGMGPIPFTLASESFPLSHREAGCAFAIAVNLLFAGVLSLVFPTMNSNVGDSGTLGIFAGLNIVAFVLVFLLVEETKRRSLEDLDLVFAVPKRTFMRYQVGTYLPWFFRHYVLRRRSPDGSGADEKPSLYVDMIWGGGSGSGPAYYHDAAGAGVRTMSSGAAAPPVGPVSAWVPPQVGGEDRDGPRGPDADAESVDSLHR